MSISRFILQQQGVDIGDTRTQNNCMSREMTLDEILEEAVAFRAAFDAVQMATVSPEGIPDASYAPCVLDDEGRCHILISGLAQHTKNLHALPVASLMWIEERASARNPFARRRLVLQCRAESIGRERPEWEALLGRMESEHGNTVPLLAGLPDFVLYRLDAIDGNYVRGFAQAHPVTGNALVTAERRTR